MRDVNRLQMAGCLMFTLAASLAGAPLYAQGGGGQGAPNGNTCDMSGEWSARSREDWEDRAQMGTHLGDYTGMPINDAARQYGRTWDAGILSLPTQQAIPHPGQYIMRGPGPNFRMSKVIDDKTQEVVGYSLVGVFGRNDRIIWTDGRPHPPEFVEFTWSGFSTGVCERGMLKVSTTHNKFGYHRRNGVPASIKAKMTEYFIRHAETLTHVQFTEDPVYLTEPLVRTTDFEINRNQNVGPPGLGFEIVDEITTWEKGYVPHFPLDTPIDEFAKEWGIPLEGAMGGAETIYPEYLPRLKRLMAEEKARAAAAASKTAPRLAPPKPAEPAKARPAK